MPMYHISILAIWMYIYMMYDYRFEVSWIRNDRCYLLGILTRNKQKKNNIISIHRFTV